MRAKLANLNDCAVPFLSRAGANLCWYYYTAAPFRESYNLNTYIQVWNVCHM